MNPNAEAVRLFRVGIHGQPEANEILVRAASMEAAAGIARDVYAESGVKARRVEVGAYCEPADGGAGLVYYPVQTEGVLDISGKQIQRIR